MKAKRPSLLLCIILDAIGCLSYVLPVLGEFFDVIWAPVSAVLLYMIFKGKKGMAGAIVDFVEELLPGTDFIPTFTLMWLYVYFFERRKEKLPQA